MAHPLREVEEEILMRLNVRDLIRCKSVCKSWKTLISGPRFIKAHLNHQCAKDRKDGRFGDRRITMCKQADYLACRKYDSDCNFFDLNDRHLLGSSNGLVCVAPTPYEILVINPSTREVREVTPPLAIETEDDFPCWGFGYESSTDDYKIVLGFRSDDHYTCFQVFSLKSNIWKEVGEVRYDITSRVGILCNEALHWLAHDSLSENQTVILSFKLSDEQLWKVLSVEGLYPSMHLGTMEERLCLFQHELYARAVCVMKELNNRESWEMFGWEREIKSEAVHSMKLLKSYIPNNIPLCHRTGSSNYWLCKNLVFFGMPVYVESLVSPHFSKKPKTKRQATSPIKSPKVKANRYSAVLALYASENANSSSSVGI